MRGGGTGGGDGADTPTSVGYAVSVFGLFAGGSPSSAGEATLEPSLSPTSLEEEGGRGVWFKTVATHTV